MSSHAQDAGTQKQASAGATQQDTALAKNAAQNQQFSNQARQNLFGTSGMGGTMGGFMDPSSLNQTGLSGTYQNQYQNAANKVANTTQNALGTTMQSLANRGMGKSPAGFAADQQRKAYQDQAGQLGDLYTGAAQGQHGEALNNFWNATNMLNSNASQTANLSLQGNQAAAGNYANLYGTASQQQQNPWAVAGGIMGQMGQAAATAYACPARGSRYLMQDGSEKLVEDLEVGDEIAGIDGEPQTIEEIETQFSPILRITTDNGLVARNSRVHAFALPSGGFTVAARCLGKTIVTAKGPGKVVSIDPDGIEEVFNVITDGSHTYRADGVWALGVGEAERHVSMKMWNSIGDRMEETPCQ